jgi:Flp pilus assembly protein TadG
MFHTNAPCGRALKDKMHSVRKARRGEEGSSIFELAVVMNFFLIPMLLGIAGGGVLVYDNIEVAQAAHEGASYAAQVYRSSSSGFTTGTLANVTTFTKAAEPNIPASALTTTPVTVSCGCLAAGSTAQVTAGCATGAKISCPALTPILFVTVNTQANITPLVNLSIFGLPATYPFTGSSTFELNP